VCPLGSCQAVWLVWSLVIMVSLMVSVEVGGYPGFPGGDGLVVALAVGVFGESLDEALGFAFVGVGAMANMTALAVGGSRRRVTVWVPGLRLTRATGSGFVDIRPCPFGARSALAGAVVQAFEHGVGAVDLVAGGAEVPADRALAPQSLVASR
jgi:hypothetical protein